MAKQKHLWTAFGTDLLLGWSGMAALDYFNGDASLPIFSMGKVASPRALSEKYYMYLWADQILNLSIQTSHTLLRDDLQAEIKVSHSRFQDQVWSGLDQYEDEGVSAIDISINFLTIVGKLSVGWSFSELEDYKGTSWAEVGLTL